MLITGEIISMRQWRSIRSMQKADHNFHLAIRSKIEKSIQPFICGEFMTKSMEAIKLPVIELFGLRSQIKANKGSLKWVKDSQHWLESWGFQSFLGIYKDTKKGVVWSHYMNDDDDLTPYRVIVFWENYLDGENIQMYGNNENIAIIYTNQDFLDSILIPFTTTEILSLGIKRVENIRAKIFVAMSKGNIFKQNLKNQLYLYNDFQQIKRTIERLLFEYNQNERYIRRDFSESEPNKMIYSRFQQQKVDENENLENAVINQISNQKDILTGHLNFLDSAFATYIDFINIASAYRLQNITLWVSIVALVITGASILINWNGILTFFRFFGK